MYWAQEGAAREGRFPPIEKFQEVCYAVAARRGVRPRPHWGKGHREVCLDGGAGGVAGAFGDETEVAWGACVRECDPEGLFRGGS